MPFFASFFAYPFPLVYSDFTWKNFFAPAELYIFLPFCPLKNICYESWPLRSEVASVLVLEARRLFAVCNDIIDIISLLMVSNLNIWCKYSLFALMRKQVEYCNKLCSIMRQHVKD